MNLMRCVIECNGQSYSTVDAPEQIGPWVGRIFSMLGQQAMYAQVRILG